MNTAENPEKEKLLYINKSDDIPVISTGEFEYGDAYAPKDEVLEKVKSRTDSIYRSMQDAESLSEYTSKAA